ncbi:cupin domain-containing protein [Pseudoduganella sp. OTU4001]|uniref:cupin domain-containing protein n=1 Tax=Pseudoduganella sp. OTU4001 TaxID=3043854 RepID=UPI00313DE266
MKSLAITLAALAYFAAQPAFALDQSATVKVTPLLKSATSWNGAQLSWPAGQAEVTALQIEITPGAETGWHLHPVPSFAYVMEGELEVSLKDGAVKRFTAGQALAEVVSTMHNGRNVGSGPVKLVVFYVGATGSTLTVKQ